MKWAKAQGYYSGDNPVELAERMPKISKIDSHHAALAFSELPIWFRGYLRRSDAFYTYGVAVLASYSLSSV